MKKQQGTSMVAVLIGLVIFTLIAVLVVEFSLKAVHTAERAYQVQTAQSVMRSAINQLNYLPFACVETNKLNQDPLQSELGVECEVQGVTVSGINYVVTVDNIDTTEPNYTTLDVAVGWDMLDDGGQTIERTINLYNIDRVAQWDALED
jgi:type II secretory pathway pseudopilin PulG